MSAPPEATGLRWRPASFVLLAGALALFALGVLLRSPVPVLLALPLLLAPVSAAVFGPRGPPGVRVTCQLTGTGQSVRVHARFRPEAPVPPEALEVTFPVPPGVGEARRPEIRADGDALAEDLFWTVPDPTVTALAPPSVIWRDPLGLVERTASVEMENVFLERYPPELHRVGAVRLRRTLARPGETRSRAVGEAGEFFGIRDAAPGDPPRRINWRASARAGRRLSNEYALDRTGDLLIVLDARPTGVGTAADGRLLAVSKAAAFGLAEAFLRDKSRVGVAAYGEFLYAVPLGTGRTQRVRVRNLLLSTPVSEVAGPAERCAVSLRRYYPPRTTTVVLSPLVGEEQANLVAHLRRRGFGVVVLSPSYLPLLRPRGDLPAEDEQFVLRFARLRRREEVRQVWADAPVVDWEDYWSLGGFVEFLGRPAGRERGG